MIEHETNPMGETVKRLVKQYDAIHEGYFKRLCMKHGIPYVEDWGVMIDTLKQKGFEFVLEQSGMSHSDGKKHYALKLCKIIDVEYYAIEPPKIKIEGEE